MTKAMSPRPGSVRPAKASWSGWLVANAETGELIGAGPSKDRAVEVWCLSRGKTYYAPCRITLSKPTRPAKRKRRQR